MNEDLNSKLLKAHAEGDIDALIGLYAQAAQDAEAGADLDAACFYRTHAFVFALQAGDHRAEALQYALYLQGRETCPVGYDPRRPAAKPQRATISGDP